MSIKHSIIIPTNHRLIENDFDFIKEASSINNSSEYEISLIIFDDVVEELNLDIIKKWQKYNNKIDCFYVNRTRMNMIYDILVEELSEENKASFKTLHSLPDKINNYGSLFNKMFLVMALLGIDSFSRRDSDVAINKSESGKYVFPLEVELRHLYSPGNNSSIVGGGYYGKFRMNYNAFIKGKDYSLLKRYFSSLSIPEEVHDDIILQEIVEQQKEFTKDYYIDNKPFPPCGNCATSSIYKHFPCSPMPHIHGTDNFLVEISNSLNLRVVQHNRNVVHHNFTVDSSRNGIFNYWYSVARTVDYDVIYKNMFHNISKESENLNDFEEYRKVVKLSMKDALDGIDELKNDREDKIIEFVEVLKLLDNADYNFAANKIFEHISIILQESEDNLKLHYKLLESWKQIMKIANKIKKDNRNIREIVKV